MKRLKQGHRLHQGLQHVANLLGGYGVEDCAYKPRREPFV